MGLPTATEINPDPGSLDGRSAEWNFLGKTSEEAFEMFQRDFSVYEEDLRWMGSVGFRFYVEAAIRYIQSEESTDDFAVPIHFASIVESRLKTEPTEILPVATQLSDACRYVFEHWEKFDMSPTDEREERERYRTLYLELLHLS
jgi:hypothetical protein